MTRATPWLLPKWAILFTVVAVLFGPICVVLAYHVWFIPWHVGFAWYGLMAYLTAAFSWSSLELSSRNSAIRGNNFFVSTVFCLLVLALFTTRNGAALPMWEIVICISAGIVGYSVAGVYGVRNFMRWRHGHYNAPQAQTMV